MMRAIALRELIVIGRRPALVIAIVAYVALLAGFVLVWADGIPLPSGSNLYDQARTVQWGLLAVCLTWAAARCPAVDRGDRLVMVSALAAMRPAAVVAAKAAAQFAVLTLVALTALPVVIIAQQMAAVPAPRVLWDQLSLLGLPLLASAVTLAWTMAISGRLGAWLGACGSVGLVLVLLWYWRPAGLDLGLASALAGLAVAALLGAWSNRSAQYLREHTA